MMNKIDHLIEIMASLRSENGCPWDKVQTHESLKRFLIEETYEVIEAIDDADYRELKEELGDLLFQIIFHCQIASERGLFNFYDVCDGIAKKMISRHPHVFSDKRYDTPEEVMRQWQERKKEEGKNRDSLFEGIPKELPSLLRAFKVQSKVSKVGFDWHKAQEVIPKLYEEIDELKETMSNDQRERTEEEIGDLLFTIVNISRLLKVNPEDALRKSINKFVERFSHIESYAKKRGITLSEMTLKEMDEIWEASKKL